MGLGFAAFGAELPELEARCHERLQCAQPTVRAATEDPQGRRDLNLFARDCPDLGFTHRGEPNTYSLAFTRTTPTRPNSRAPTLPTTTTHPDEQTTTVAAFTHGPETLENTLQHASSRSVLRRMHLNPPRRPNRCHGRPRPRRAAAWHRAGRHFFRWKVAGSDSRGFCRRGKLVGL